MGEPVSDRITLRAQTNEDAVAIQRVLAARDSHDYGDPSFTRAELLARWQTGSFVPGEDAVIAESAGAICGYAAVFNVGALAFVDPAHEGRGIGRALLAWTERRERERRGSGHRQRVAITNDRARALLEAAGYAQVRTVWQMVTALGDPAAPPVSPAGIAPAVPAGITLEVVDPQRDAEVLHAADEAAFARNDDYVPETLEDFRTEHLASEQLDVEASVVARRGGAVAGFAICQRLAGGVGYVDLLAVTETERGQGLGTVILAHALSAFARAGLREARLEVASDNPGALRLYERAGMVRRHGAAIWEKPLEA